jgi:hypothetical protein
VAQHLQAIVLKENNMDFFQCNEDIRKKFIDHPGFILGYNYQNKIYKLFDVKELVYTNFYLIKHLVSKYLLKINKKKLYKKMEEMTLSNTNILDEIFKDKYVLDMEAFNIKKI